MKTPLAGLLQAACGVVAGELLKRLRRLVELGADLTGPLGHVLSLRLEASGDFGDFFAGTVVDVLVTWESLGMIRSCR
jgi:hypothetical protein